jgi:hypothetical protein
VNNSTARLQLNYGRKLFKSLAPFLLMVPFCVVFIDYLTLPYQIYTPRNLNLGVHRTLKQVKNIKRGDCAVIVQ